MTLPGIQSKETVETVRNKGYEGRNILVIGSAGFKEDISKVYTLYNWEDAFKKLKPTSKEGGKTTEGSNILRSIIHDIFLEGDVTGPSDTFGLNKVYAINIGPEPTIETLIKALELSETLYDVEIEAYPELNNIAALNLIKGHLKYLESYGDYRIAIATTPKKATVTDMVKMTNSEEDCYISSGRIVLHVDPDMVGVFAAKVACTPYYEDPAYRPYKSITSGNITKYRREELAELVNAGLVVDWEIVRSVFGKKVVVVEPVYTHATNYTSLDTPADAHLHQRLNADHQSKETDEKARVSIKQNNTKTAKHSIELQCQAYLEEEMKKERLEGFTYQVYANRKDPYGLIVKMTVKPVKSIHSIEINRIIQG